MFVFLVQNLLFASHLVHQLEQQHRRLLDLNNTKGSGGTGLLC